MGVVVMPVVIAVVVGGVVGGSALVAGCVGVVRIDTHGLGGGPPGAFCQTSRRTGSP